MISSWARVGFPFGFGVGSWHPERLCRRRRDFIMGAGWIPLRVWRRFVAPQRGSAGGGVISSWVVLGFSLGFGVGSWHPREALQEAA